MKEKTLGFRCPKKLQDKLKIYSKKGMISSSDFIRIAIAEKIEWEKKKEAGNNGS